MKEEYPKLFDTVDQNLQSFSFFNPSQDRVDTLFSITMGSSKLCTNLWDFVKMFLILHHGQSAIERGFNINKQLLVENLKPESLVALGRIEDRMRYSEQSPETIKVPNKIIQSVKEAHSSYQSELAKHRTEKEDTQKSIKRKIVTAEIKAVKKKGSN